MDSLEHNEDVYDFNFWPSFADLMLSLVLILVFFYVAIVATGMINMRGIRDSQMHLIDDISETTGQEKQEAAAPDTYIIGKDIIVKNEPTVQKISFADNILFDVNRYELKEQGRTALRSVGAIIVKNLASIREIQIQAHADITPITNDTNLKLGSRRANEVYEFLKNVVGIDPASHLMSSTSFGEFKPVNRSEEDSNYNLTRLHKDNSTKEQKAMNRRIELLLFYKIS